MANKSIIIVIVIIIIIIIIIKISMGYSMVLEKLHFNTSQIEFHKAILLFVYSEEIEFQNKPEHHC